MQNEPDVLILHGKSEDIVEYLKTLLGSLGINAETVLNMPSLRKPQEDRVDYWIKNCRTALVLATFDADEKKSKKARSNVYDEITRCRRFKTSETIILREKKDGDLVELPSNVAGKLVIIEFDAQMLHVAIPQLLREIRSRGFLERRNKAERTAESGGILNEFLDKMDGVWDKEFDIAWKKIHRLDYEAERELTIALDHFFQLYQKVFSALIRQKKTGDELREVCDRAYEESLKWAARAWENAADAKIKKADILMQSGKELKHQKIYEQAANELRKAKRHFLDMSKISGYRKSIELIEAFINKSKSS